MTGWFEAAERPEEVIPDLVEALAEMPMLPLDQKATVPTKSGGQYSYDYTSLGEVVSTARRVLAEHKLAMVQPVSTIGDDVVVRTVILHLSGGWISFPPFTLPVGHTAQETGASVTYARRYAATAALSLVAESDTDARGIERGDRRPPEAPRRPTFRSEYERTFITLMDSMDPEAAKAARAEFREVFGQGLTTLPIAQHEQAVRWLEGYLEDLDEAEAEIAEEAESAEDGLGLPVTPIITSDDVSDDDDYDRSMLPREVEDASLFDKFAGGSPS